jgi:hypothetical protein
MVKNVIYSRHAGEILLNDNTLVDLKHPYPFAAVFWAVHMFLFGGSGPAMSTHVSLSLHEPSAKFKFNQNVM